MVKSARAAASNCKQWHSATLSKSGLALLNKRSIALLKKSSRCSLVRVTISQAAVTLSLKIGNCHEKQGKGELNELENSLSHYDL